jgi:glycosyltransferase involved in cell wall biosynthesis
MPDQRPCRILVTATSRIPSVELGAILPLRELMQQRLCDYIYADEEKVTAAHVAWADVVLPVRACSSRVRSITEVARAAGRKVVCYYDDDFLDLPAGSPSQVYYASGGIRRNLIWFVEHADLLCFCNADLAGAYGELTSRPTLVLPVGIECPPVADRSCDRVRVLFAASVDHAAFVDEICSEALHAAASQPHVEVHCIGAKPRLVSLLPVQYIPYIDSYADYRSLIAPLAPDICLAPLPASSFYSRKFYNKLLDYGSLGAAVIFSNVPPYPGVVEDGVTGLLAENTSAAWQRALARLVADADLRRRLGKTCLDYVREHHSLSRVAESYAEGLAPLLSYRAPAIEESACPVPVPSILRDYVADHGILRALRRGLRKLVGI